MKWPGDSPRPKTISFTCRACHQESTFPAEHCTLAMDGDRVVVLALCATENVTVSTNVPDSLLQQMLSVPVLVDPDVRDHLKAKAKR